MKLMRVGATGGIYKKDLGGEDILYYFSGKGARIKGTFSLTRGDEIQILVGQVGERSREIGSGGGGTFVYKPADGLTDGLLIAAGGGGGANLGQSRPS
jgi:hypothetical protein